MRKKGPRLPRKQLPSNLINSQASSLLPTTATLISIRECRALLELQKNQKKVKSNQIMAILMIRIRKVKRPAALISQASDHIIPFHNQIAVAHPNMTYKYRGR